MRFIGNPALGTMIRTDRDPTRGIRQAAIHLFATEAAANEFCATLLVDQSYTKEPDPPGWRVAVYSPDAVQEGEDPDQNDVYELLANHVEKDLFEHPSAKAIDEDEIRKIKEALKNPRPGTSPALTDPDAITLYLLMLKGTTKFAQDEFVLRYTLTISSRSSLQASFQNCNKLFVDPTNTALGGVTVPTGIGFALGEIVQTVPSAVGFAWRWLKKSPVVRSLPSGKIQISQEFWLDNWSTFIYQAAA